MSNPAWYTDLVNLSQYISIKDWSSTHNQAKELSKLLYVEAPSVKSQFEQVVLLTMNPEAVTPEIAQKIAEAYEASIKAADQDLSTDDFARVMKEEQLADRLDILSGHINSSLRIIWDYWWGENSGDYKEFIAIKEEIESSPLTRLGRLRLLARHATIEKRIMPSFMKMVVQLWPIAALWVIKKVGTLLISSTVTKTLEARKTRKQLAGLSERMKGFNVSVPSLKKTSPRRKRRRKQAKRR